MGYGLFYGNLDYHISSWKIIDYAKFIKFIKHECNGCGVIMPISESIYTTYIYSRRKIQATFHN